MNSSKKQSGVGMVEVLVTLLVLAIGLLGAAQLQILNLQNSRASEARMVATMLASDLGERLRANRFGANSGFYNGLIISTTPGEQHAAPSAPECSDGCSAQQQAAHDVREWLENFTDITGIGGEGQQYVPLIPEASANLSSDNGNTVFTLTIFWHEQDSQIKRLVPRSYTQAIEL